VLTYTRFGRYVYMVGGNREAAEYSGVNVKFIIGSVMVICAVCSGIAGMLGVAYFGSAQQNQFDTFLLGRHRRSGGRRHQLFGGRGGIGNTIIGLLVLGVVNNGLDHIQIDSFLKILIRGLILLAALIINVYAQQPEKEGRHHNIERREKRCVGECGLNHACLLQTTRHHEDAATQHAETRDGPDALAGLAAFPQSKGQQGNGRDGAAQPGKQQRPDMSHRLLLEIEGQPPEKGRKQHQKTRGLPWHWGIRLPSVVRTSTA
jgi:hypothetical protein